MIREWSAVRSLRLPDSWVAAGYVRNYVWDILHGYATRTPLHDVDVVYFDRTDCSAETEKQLETELANLIPGVPWSVKNQARMHLRNGDHPYLSTADAMLRWPETATAVAIRLTENNEWEGLAPHGWADVMGLRLRQSPYFGDRDYFFKRIHVKKWLEQWPRLQVVEPNESDHDGLGVNDDGESCSRLSALEREWSRGDITMEIPVYQHNGECSVYEVVELFRRSGIRRPVDDPDRIGRMLMNADERVTARVNGQLVGLLRAITDYSYCCYISDIAVDSQWQGHGIGRKLVEQLRHRLGDLEIQYILTSAPKAVGFYERIGFERAEKAFVIKRKIN